MSQETLERIIGRAAIDSRFRREMIKQPTIALREYRLSEEQISAIKAIPTDALEKFACRLMEVLREECA